MLSRWMAGVPPISHDAEVLQLLFKPPPLMQISTAPLTTITGRPMPSVTTVPCVPLIHAAFSQCNSAHALQKECTNLHTYWNRVNPLFV